MTAKLPAATEAEKEDVCLSTSCPLIANAAAGLGFNPKLRQAEKCSFSLSSYSVLQPAFLSRQPGRHTVPELGQLT